MNGTRRSVVTIGTYDGVHLGHQRLISEARSEAGELGLRSVVVTFDRHPSATIRPATATKLITDLDLKLELLEASGIDEVVVLDFDQARAQETPEAFAAELVTDLEAMVVIVGENFRFGHNHRGDVDLLVKLGGDLGFAARGIALVTDDTSSMVVSSRAIRGLITEGSLGEASRLLGRPYELRGTWAGGEITPADDLCRPPAGDYEVTLRLPRELPVGGPMTATISDHGAVTVRAARSFDEVADGDLVGLLFAATR
jgi:riboflavin kinase/FMN adenylyltransferase